MQHAHPALPCPACTHSPSTHPLGHAQRSVGHATALLLAAKAQPQPVHCTYASAGMPERRMRMSQYGVLPIGPAGADTKEPITKPPAQAQAKALGYQSHTHPSQPSFR